MRFHLIGLVLLASAAAPALAQRSEPVERRVERLEQQLRAVQRRVFPDGQPQIVQPEIRPGTTTSDLPGVTGDALTNIVSRLDALEGQLRNLTGQVEEQGFRTRQLEDQVTQLRRELDDRLDQLEQARAAPPPAAEALAEEQASETSPAENDNTTEEQADNAPAAAADSAEEAYNAGYRLWAADQFAEAQRALNEAATRYPDSPWVSWARNLEGRAYLDDGKPATAARIFLANYQDHPQGERAADSLYFLGQALTRLNRRSEACRVYDELARVYPDMRDFIRTRLPESREAANCDE